MTEILFREDAYLRQAPATIVSIDDDGSIVLDRTLFYAQGGGQPGDTGRLVASDGRRVAITDTVYAPDRITILHRPAADSLGLLRAGEPVVGELDWDKRFGRMRVHTALHLLTAVLPFPVTGGLDRRPRGPPGFRHAGGWR